MPDRNRKKFHIFFVDSSKWFQKDTFLRDGLFVAPIEIYSRLLRFFSAYSRAFDPLFVISYNYERVVLSVIIILVVEWTVGLQDAVRHFTQIFLVFIVKKYLSAQTKKSIITLYCLERVLEGFTTCSLMNF